MTASLSERSRALIAETVEALPTRRGEPSIAPAATPDVAATVECEVDAACSSRTDYRIVAPTRAAAQAVIDRVMAVVDDRGGMALFEGPRRLGDGTFGALGYSVVTP